MITLYENPFSPFARKIRMVLEVKDIEYEAVDGLKKSNHDLLAGVNGRVEVPAIVHDGLVVVNSSDIVAYLERCFPEPAIYPGSAAGWVQARAWERCADTVVDAILTDISYWTWADRPDTMPTGLKEAAQEDLDLVYKALEQALEGQDFVCGALSIADLALFPHIASTRLLGVSFDGARFPNLLGWLKRLRAHPVCAADLMRTKQYLAAAMAQGADDIERTKIFWRGDRIEWVLARGYEDWFLAEIKAGRVLWPGLGVPGPRQG